MSHTKAYTTVDDSLRSELTYRFVSPLVNWLLQFVKDRAFYNANRNSLSVLNAFLFALGGGG
jgi:hypothetical protein